MLLLSEDGTTEPIAGPPSSLLHPIILLPRRLCRLQPYVPPQRLSGRAAADAALLFAEANAPFADTGTFVARAGRQFNVWSWDRRRINHILPNKLKGATVLVPETVFHAPRDGVAIIDLGGAGIEAQVWDDGVLVASRYNAEAIAPAAWALFLQSAAVEGPDLPPQPEARSFSPPPDLGAIDVQPGPEWRRIANGAVAGLFIVGALTLFQLGSVMHLSTALSTEKAAIAALDQFRLGQSEQAAIQRQLTALRRTRALVDQPNPVSVLADALTLAQTYGISISTFAVEQDRVRFGIEGGDPDALQDFAVALEDSPTFAAVTPQLSADDGITYFFADVNARRRGAS